MNLSALIESRQPHTFSTNPSKALASKEIAAHTAAFEKSGGKIERIGIVVRSDHESTLMRIKATTGLNEKQWEKQRKANKAVNAALNSQRKLMKAG